MKITREELEKRLKKVNNDLDKIEKLEKLEKIKTKDDNSTNNK